MVHEQMHSSHEWYRLFPRPKSSPLHAAFRTAAFKRRVPVYIGHGTGDIVINWQSQEAFFKKFKQLDPTYPVKFALFDTGSHGTPIRMTDWRLILNWMLAQG